MERRKLQLQLSTFSTLSLPNSSVIYKASAVISSEHVFGKTYSAKNSVNVIEATYIPQDLSISHPFDEARHNLATRIMSNGVEVIIASDKNKLDEGNSLETNPLNQSSNVTQKPMTLPPSTIKNQMIIMLLSSSSTVQQNFSSKLQAKTTKFTLLPDADHFFTKTCITTYTYRITYLRNSGTIVESKEKIISNVATENRHYPEITYGQSMGMTLTRTPDLAVGAFATTYSYYNTIIDYNNNPVIITSAHTVINTITGPDDYIAYLQPIESATPVLETNTYYTKILLTNKNDTGAILHTMSNILTQVIITRSLPPAHITSVLTSYYYMTGDDVIRNVSKYLESHHSFSLSEMQLATLSPQSEESGIDNIQFYTTSIYIEAYQTHGAENIVTKRIPHTLIHSDLMSKVRSDLHKKNNKRGVLVAMATLENGEILKITAVDIMKNSVPSYAASVIPQAIITANSSSDTVHKNVSNKHDPTVNNPHPNKYANDTKYIQINQKQNKTQLKILKQKEPKTPEQLPTNQLIQRLTVLKPMFNVVAGLFQNNFGIPNRTQPVKLIQNIYVPQKKLSNDKKTGQMLNRTSHPLYIPILSLQNAEIKAKIENSIDQIPQSLRRKPVAPNPQSSQFNNNNNWLISLLSEKKRLASSSTKLQTPMQNGGIPIRPGEVITANSDVIVGKPNGIVRQIPLNHLINSHNIVHKQYKGTLLKSPLLKTSYADRSTNLGTEAILPLIPTNEILNTKNFKNTSAILYKQQKRVGNFDNNILRPPPLSSIVTQPLFSLPLAPTPKILIKANNYSGTSLFKNTFVQNNVFNLPLMSNASTKNGLSVTTIKKNKYSTVKPWGRIQSLQTKFLKPPNILKNTQQISLDQNVLSHNVNVHVPPLTFNWDHDYPQRASFINGQIVERQYHHQLSVTTPSKKVYMPLVKIPNDRQEMQIDLTPLKILGTIAPSVGIPPQIEAGNSSRYIPLPTPTTSLGNSNFRSNETDSHVWQAEPMYFINANNEIPLGQRMSDILLGQNLLNNQLNLQSEWFKQFKKNFTVGNNNVMEDPEDILYQHKSNHFQEKLNREGNYADDEFKSQKEYHQWLRTASTTSGEQSTTLEANSVDMEIPLVLENADPHQWVKENDEPSSKNQQTHIRNLSTRQEIKHVIEPLLSTIDNRSTIAMSYYPVLFSKPKGVFLSGPRQEINLQSKKTGPITKWFIHQKIGDVSKSDRLDNGEPPENPLNNTVKRESLWETGPQLFQMKQTLKGLVIGNWSISKTNAKYNNNSTSSIQKTKNDIDEYDLSRSSTSYFYSHNLKLLPNIYSLNPTFPASTENLASFARKTFIPRKRYSTLQKESISSITPELASTPLTYFKITPTMHVLNKKFDLVSQFSRSLITSESSKNKLVYVEQLKSNSKIISSKLNAIKLLHSLESSETYLPASLTTSFWITTITTTTATALKTVETAAKFMGNTTYSTEAATATATIITPTETVKTIVSETSFKINTITSRTRTFMNNIKSAYSKILQFTTVTTAQLTTSRTLQNQPILITSSLRALAPHFSLFLESVTIQEYEYQEQNDNVTEVNNIPHLKNHAQITYKKKPYPSVEILVPDSSLELGNSVSFRKHQWTSSTDEGPDSIFIVMTNDKKNSKLTSQQVKDINTDLRLGNDSRNSNSTLLDYDYNLSFDLPTNDENLFLSRNIKTNATYNVSAVVNNIRVGDMFVQTSPESTIEKYTYDYNYPFSSDFTSRLQYNKNVVETKCQPACKSTHNEYCTFIDYDWRCSCRPGFARIFPHHFCKPTFTYICSIQALRIRSYPVKQEKDFLNDTTDYFEQLVHTLYDAFDRMVMQSDFRDVCNGIQLANFSVNKIPENKETTLAYDNLTVNFLFQLSKNSNEKRLQEVFKKQLRLSNYSIGGTDLYISGADSLIIMDFDECNNNKFHDCSSNAHCFNLQGTYTCSCREGFIDLSKNNVHPGRLCSAEIIGCAQCQYQGKCTLSGLKSNSYICECFLWYTGAKCGVNLKMFLIGFIAAGSFLLSLLFFSVLLTYIRRKKVCGVDPSILTCITIPDHPDFNRDKEFQSTSPHCASKYYNSSSNCVRNVSGALPTAKSKKKGIILEKCAIIKDSSSDSSDNSVVSTMRTKGTLADTKKLLKSNIAGRTGKRLNNFTTTGTFLNQRKQRNMRVLLDSSVFMSATTAYNNKNYAVSDQNFSNLRSKYDFSDPNESSQNKIGAESLHDGHYGEESDRSLTVMIPRAKYYPSAMQQILLQHQLAMERNNNLQCERGTQNEEDILFEINKCTNIANSSGNIGLEVQIMPGALVSAGYEVSAIVKESNSAFASNYPEQSPNLTASEDLRQELARSIRCDRVKFHCATK
ncbi:uncharacterized protein LOC119643744 isoform X2 [Glossina fuscipes]|uniref:Uncharacterized protein LOC119643744 isoform X2 n=1 Tax=Glossina fuscipes TaxID=7396 RepID=A0A9C6E0M6_9MUSC|nr:uncharacterized protein LOC119643744 isoform X2 [Glossina fuscipes]